MLAKLGKVDLAQKCFDELKVLQTLIVGVSDLPLYIILIIVPLFIQALNGLTDLCYSHLVYAYEKSKVI